MLLLTCLGFLAVSTALPTQQIIAPATTLTAIPATNHILILTPQAQVQLEPSLKLPIVQHLSPVARIDGPTDQTVVFYPNENLKSVQKPKQLGNANITNILNQFVTAGQTAQAQLQAFQEQLTQGLEGLTQPSGQKIEIDGSADATKPILSTAQQLETLRQESGRFYSVSSVPQYYSNFEVIHAPLFAVPHYQSIRARSVAHRDDNIALSAKPIPAEVPILDKIADQPEIPETKKPLLSDNQARSVENLEEAVPSVPESPEVKSHPIPSEPEHVPVSSNFGKYLGSLEKNAAAPEIQPYLKITNDEAIDLKDQAKDSELVSFAEAIPSGLAISGEGGLSQTKPIGSAIVGKDGVAYSAPSATSIAGSNDNEKIPKTL